LELLSRTPSLLKPLLNATSLRNCSGTISIDESSLAAFYYLLSSFINVNSSSACPSSLSLPSYYFSIIWISNEVCKSMSLIVSTAAAVCTETCALSFLGISKDLSTEVNRSEEWLSVYCWKVVTVKVWVNVSL
jgi:hypothetical protein